MKTNFAENQRANVIYSNEEVKVALEKIKNSKKLNSEEATLTTFSFDLEPCVTTITEI